MHCGSCGAILDGRFCGDCGLDSNTSNLSSSVSAETAPTVVSQSSFEPPTVFMHPPEVPPTVYVAPPPLPPTVYVAPPPLPPPPAAQKNHPQPRVRTGNLDSLGGLFEGGWRGLTGNAADWIVNYVVAAVILGAVVFLFGVYDWLITDEENFGGFTITTKDPIRPLELLLIFVALVSVAFVLYAFDQAALRVARNERPIVNDVWSPKRFPAFVVMVTLLLSVSIVAFVVPFVGPIVLAAVLLYAPFYVIDGRGSGVTSLFRSVDTATKPGVFSRQLLFSFLLSVFALVGIGLILLGYWVVLSAGADVWSTTWRNIAALVIFAVGGAAYLMALAVVRTAAAIAYLGLDNQDDFSEAR
jgi:hypothetical protein